ncbi:capsular polysaccharide biosynthesis protein [Tropicimonas sp. S265A]|uniref:capsular polysaccharide biosynthesis protein n=1 Tax=Tropicimonas sp. S265A TaxID=3415134 RepID=UPI003C7BEDEF
MIIQRGASGPPGAPRSRLYISSLSHLTNRRVRRILSLAGYTLCMGLPGSDDLVALWGQGHTATRGAKLARIHGASLLHLEDGFFRSVLPGRTGAPTLSLIVDQRGPYFDSAVETDLEHLLQNSPLEDPKDLARAEHLITRLVTSGVSKYNSATAPAPEAGFVLVVDQTRGDRSIAGAQASADTFAWMLDTARREHPDRRIVVQEHPETSLGLRPGHFETLPSEVTRLEKPVPPYALLDAAHAVYTVSSQLGFEAILAGHRPVVFGQAFYAGWGLSDDRAAPIQRRTRLLTKAQLALGTLVKYPLCYDPYHDRLCAPEQVIDALEVQSRAYREDHVGAIALGMRLWKRSSIARFFRDGPVRFATNAAEAGHLAQTSKRPVLAWGNTRTVGLKTACRLERVEDGFIRSAGLGAELVPALSLVRDPIGIYYDPAAPSGLEHLIAASRHLPACDLRRADTLHQRLVRLGASKYNLRRAETILPETSRPRILVVGQVEDDASVLWGAVGSVKTNAALLRAARAAHPEGFLIFKPHPDVEAGLRDGGRNTQGADLTATFADPVALLSQVDEVWTMTSLLGFEALLHGRKVVTCGLPFYAGWGLTRDLVPQTHAGLTRRASVKGQVRLAGLVHAALIDYPRYVDPVTGLACPVDIILDRLESGTLPEPSTGLRALSKLQGVFASLQGYWR